MHRIPEIANRPKGSAIESVWRYQPLVPVAVSFAAGVSLDRHWPIRGVVWMTIIACAVLVWFALRTISTSRRIAGSNAMAWENSLVVLLAISAVGGAWHHVYWHVYPANDIGHWCDRQSRPARVRGILVEEPLVVRPGARNPLKAVPEQIHSICQIQAQAIWGAQGWISSSGQAHLVSSGELAHVHAGDAVDVLGELIAPGTASNPGEFDYSSYLRGRRTRAILRCGEAESVTIVSDSGSAGPAIWIARIAGACERRLLSRLPPGQAEVAVALLLGRYELLEEEVTERYMRTGTMHILAISGQHLAILAGFLWLLLRFFPLPHKWGAAALAVIVVCYALLTGARPPVLRAAVLVCVLVGAIVLNARSRLANPLALALLIVLAMNPADLFDRGLQLSFLAVAALSWIVRPAWNWFQSEPDPLDQLVAATRPHWQRVAASMGRGIGYALVMSAVVWLANVPLLAARFHLFSPIVVLLTVVMTPLATVALIAGLLLLLVDPWLPWAGGMLGKLCGFGIAGMDRCVQVGSRIPGGYWYVPGPSEWWVVGFYVGVVGVLLFRPTGRKRMRWAAIGVAWLALGFAVPTLRAAAPNQLECQILAVGNGSATVLRLPNGRTVLVDAGQISGPRVGARQIAPALWESGITRLDAVFVSHADVDHFNGLPHLIERFSVGEVFVPPHFARAEQAAVRLVCDMFAERNIPVRVCWAGDRFELSPGIVASVLHPPAEFAGDDNEQSLVILVESFGKRLLLTGDIAESGLRRLLATPPTPVDVLVAPHHGSRRANPPELIQWARPKLVVVSQGKPRSGATLDVYRDAGIPVFSTNERGTVTLRFGAGDTLEIQTVR